HQDRAKHGPEVLRQHMPDDVVLVDFLRYTHLTQDRAKPGRQGERRTVRYVAFVVSRHNVERVELGAAAEIDAAVRAWREAITVTLPARNDAAVEEHETKLSRRAAAMRKLLWEPVETHMPTGTATVYLVPDNELTQLPWAALPGRGKDRVLLDDYALA